MRFMLLMHPADRGPDWGPQHPDAVEAVAAMGRFNEEALQAGILLALDGLHPLEEGARVSFGTDGESTVVDGPFAEAKELVGGYWLIEVKDKAEALEWVKRVPAGDGDMIEIRRVFELSEWSEEAQEAGRLAAPNAGAEARQSWPTAGQSSQG